MLALTDRHAGRDVRAAIFWLHAGRGTRPRPEAPGLSVVRGRARGCRAPPALPDRLADRRADRRRARAPGRGPLRRGGEAPPAEAARPPDRSGRALRDADRRRTP